MQVTFNLSSQVHRRQQRTWGSDSVTSRAQPQSLLFTSSCRITRESKTLQIGRCKPSRETGRAPVTCSRADLCRMVSPGGPWSAIAFATRRATEVEFG